MKKEGSVKKGAAKPKADAGQSFALKHVNQADLSSSHLHVGRNLCWFGRVCSHQQWLDTQLTSIYSGSGSAQKAFMTGKPRPLG